MKEIEKNHLNISKLKRKQNKTTKSQKLGRLNYPLKLDPLCQVTEGRDLHLPSAKDPNVAVITGAMSAMSAMSAMYNACHKCLSEGPFLSLSRTLDI